MRYPVTGEPPFKSSRMLDQLKETVLDVCAVIVNPTTLAGASAATTGNAAVAAEDAARVMHETVKTYS
jgi:trimethylamine:corrinoid methyltransferase-like protein